MLNVYFLLTSLLCGFFFFFFLSWFHLLWSALLFFFSFLFLLFLFMSFSILLNLHVWSFEIEIVFNCECSLVFLIICFFHHYLGSTTVKIIICTYFIFCAFFGFIISACLLVLCLVYCGLLALYILQLKNNNPRAYSSSGIRWRFLFYFTWTACECGSCSLQNMLRQEKQRPSEYEEMISTLSIYISNPFWKSLRLNGCEGCIILGASSSEIVTCKAFCNSHRLTITLVEDYCSIYSEGWSRNIKIIIKKKSVCKK